MDEPPGAARSPRAWSPVDLAALQEAKRKLEYPSLATRIANTVGAPIESGLRMLPPGFHRRTSKAVEHALLTALEMSVRTMGRKPATRSRDRLHKALVVGTGTAGGAIGLAAMTVELPLSTLVILRSIADIARAEGHDISQLDVRLACLEVFALGGGGSADEAAETGYWAVRTVLASQVTAAARSIAEKGFADTGAPAIIHLIQRIAPRFAAVVGQQVAAKAVPVIGAVSGGTINYLFITHFQDVASGHFVVKRLEKTYGVEAVRRAYEAVKV